MIFNKIKGLHIDGKKSLVNEKEILSFLEPKHIYIPLKTNVIYEPQVNVGDYVLKGDVVAKRLGKFGHNVHSSVSGKVTSIKKIWHPSGKMVETLEIENDFQEKINNDKKICFELSKESIIDIMQNIGLVGLGGAGFPTFAKYKDQNAKILIINCVECEPYLNTDYSIIINECEMLLNGIKYLQIASGATRVVIAIKKNKKDAITILNNLIEAYDGFELLLLKDVYPAGYEKYIVQKVIKKDYNGLPISEGVIVNNAQTAYALARSIKEGLPLIEKYITVSGEGVNNPSVIRVKIGCLLSEVIEYLNGYKDEPSGSYLILGGPMTGNSVACDDVVITAEASGACIIKKSTIKYSLECMGCGKCSTHCPVKLTPTEIKQAFISNDLELLKELNATKCIQCGLCSYVCPSRIEISDYVNKARNYVYKNESHK